MADAKDRDGGEPAEKPEAGGPGGTSPADTPAAEDAKRQDKTKDKPDSGQNEDG
ncbi:hypothetical protein [Lichenibacterium dinghuense]|uniref:hypothetical protein n=1 Tax=Lichenibacterium dinghuense TaxID=2895977 RepID=UPI001F1CA2CC|nr:hypothetical protein [Lichenibacterium sp. 6Y81]